MSDLISRSAFIKLLKANTMSNGTLINTNTMLALVEKMPTAYDVEKVCDFVSIDYYKNGGMLIFDDVITQIRKGGV